MEREIHCNNCDAEFMMTVVEESNETNKVNFCPFCGSDDVVDWDEDLLEDELDD